MTSVLLIYPFFIPNRDRSVFRFPPLGLSYLAASLRADGHEVHLLDCTFSNREAALVFAQTTKAEAVGIYCMVTLVEDCLWFANQLRDRCKLLVAGGPLPTCDPLPFMEHFDVVVRGEGEQTMKELLRARAEGLDLTNVPGIVYKTKNGGTGRTEGKITFTADRPFERNLDQIPSPARDLLPNDQYIHYGKKKYGYSITTIMSTRGCPYRCEFCSNVVFGGSFRARSPESVADEIGEVLALGYDRVSFADDVFTMNHRRVLDICREIERRDLRFNWECLGRVDALDYATALEMKKAGCTRIYFGIESGNNQILELMNKNITVEQARKAVEDAHRAGLEVGAFFILFYPGETDDTVLDTLHFATRLPLDYLGLSMPYPLPGTTLYERIGDQITREWRTGESLFGGHMLTYDSDFSEAKMWFGLIKGHLQFKLRRRFGKLGPVFVHLFERPTDGLLRLMR